MAASGPTRRPPRAPSAPSLTRYDSLFSIEMARRQLKSDIENSIDQIKERLLATRLDPRTTTLRELVENELKPEVYGPEKCRDRAFACRDRVGVSAWRPGPATAQPSAQPPAQPHSKPMTAERAVPGRPTVRARGKTRARGRGSLASTSHHYP